VLRRLIEDLRVRGPLDLDVGSILARHWGQWKPGDRPLVSRAGDYTRTQAYRDDRFEVLLLNWASGAASKIHDHGDQHCWMVVLEGLIEVEDYIRLDTGETPGYAHVERCGTQILEPGGLDLRSGRFDLHRVSAAKNAAAVSLHVYAGPLQKFLVYDEAKRSCQEAGSVYDELLSFDFEPARQ
jgi:predicted metal-dependent enzyme (double-stranded beta helix superfamily)